MRSICVLLFLITILESIVWSSAANREKRMNAIDLNTNFMKINEKFDSLSDRLNKLEENSSSAGNDAILSAIEQLARKTDLLFDMIETLNEEKMNKRDTDGDVMRELNSQCTSLCQSKVNILAHETRNTFNRELLELDFCLPNATLNNNNNACQPNPCANGELCQAVSHHCVKCPYLRSGKNCEVVQCTRANKCMEYGGQMYVVLEEHMLWEDAYVRCAREGMGLAMPKDKDTTEFLITELKKMYAPSQHKHFYIGLRNVNGGAEWRWTDGTLLAGYVGGYTANFKGGTGPHYGILYLHAAEYKVPTTYWHPQSLSEILKGSTYYPLCTKRI